MFWHAPESAPLSKADFTEKRSTPSAETDVLFKALQHVDEKRCPMLSLQLLLLLLSLLCYAYYSILKFQIFSLSAVLRFCRQVKENRLRSS